MKIKVGIIENQITHFREISKRLDSCNPHPGNKFEIFPTEDDYNCITNLARIALDSRYYDDRRTVARGRLTQWLNGKNLDVLIVDHILLGFAPRHINEGLSETERYPNGINLIRDMFNPELCDPILNHYPVLFLSATPYNSKSIAHLDDKKWPCDVGWRSKNQEYDTEAFGSVRYYRDDIIKKLMTMARNNPHNIENLQKKFNSIICELSLDSHAQQEKTDKINSIIDEAKTNARDMNPVQRELIILIKLHDPDGSCEENEGAFDKGMIDFITRIED